MASLPDPNVSATLLVIASSAPAAPRSACVACPLITRMEAFGKATYERLLSALLKADMIANESFDTRVEQLDQMEERRRARARERQAEAQPVTRVTERLPCRDLRSRAEPSRWRKSLNSFS